jgi:hypothetical protein
MYLILITFLSGTSIFSLIFPVGREKRGSMPGDARVEIVEEGGNAVAIQKSRQGKKGHVPEDTCCALAAVVAATAFGAKAQGGDIAAGYAFAREACRACHIVDPEARDRGGSTSGRRPRVCKRAGNDRNLQPETPTWRERSPLTLGGHIQEAQRFDGIQSRPSRFDRGLASRSLRCAGAWHRCESSASQTPRRLVSHQTVPSALFTIS